MLLLEFVVCGQCVLPDTVDHFTLPSMVICVTCCKKILSQNLFWMFRV